MIKSFVFLNKLSYWVEIICLLVISSSVLADFTQENISKSKKKLNYSFNKVILKMQLFNGQIWQKNMKTKETRLNKQQQ